jgi:hypothetical protein
MANATLQVIHPLAESLKQVQTADEQAYADSGDLESGWFLATALLDSCLNYLDDALTRQAKEHPQMEARTRGSYLIGNYSWYVPLAVIATYLADNRVPDFSPENVALRYRNFTWYEDGESGEAERIDVRFLSGRFACLPDDPSSDHPDAIILTDRDALREWLHTALEAHFSLLIERIFVQTRLSRYAQWCLVADSCAALFLHIGRALGDEAHGQAEGLKCETFRAMGGCCRYYTVSETGQDYCSTCVLRKPEDRNQRLLNYMAKKYAQEIVS